MTTTGDRLGAALAGRYAVESELRRGGMAIVYRAEDVKHRRKVAIKVLRPDLAASIGAERFLSEIAICASLAHPHILPLHDSGEADGLLYYVMPFVEGESLRDLLLREKQLSLTDALRVTRGVGAALGYAHSRGIVHRDIKPENILLVAGEPAVADFGIAKALSVAAEERLTGTGVVIGTPAYMSPEQASGEPDVDARTDIYSLGCVLFEMLAGVLPYTGPSAMAITARKLADPVPRLSLIRESVPPVIEQAVAKALARTPADRFATAAEFVRALEEPQGGARAMAVSARDPAPAEAPISSVVVLPFANVGAGADDEFLSDGITEELIHALARIEGVRVVARTSAFAFKGRQEDVREIGRHLNVGAVLEGSVRRAGGRLRITARLVSVADGYQLWSERYDRELDDVFAVQDDISRAIVRTLRPTLTGASRRVVPAATADLAAYELYLRGRHAWNKRTEDGLRKSVECLTRAIEADPRFAQAHAGLADAYVTLGIYGVEPPEAVMPLAKDAADRALAIEPTLAEALSARGCARSLFDWDWTAAREDFERAIEAAPRYATAPHWYAVNHLAPLGRLDEARAQLAVAQELDPLSPAIGVSIGLVSYLGRDFPQAVEEYRAVIELDEHFGVAHYFLGQAYEQQARYDEALAAFRKAVSLTGESAETVAALGRACALAGRRAEAESCRDALLARAAQRYVSPVLHAQLSLALGEREAALENLTRAYARRAVELVWLGVRPVYDELRGEPRFIDLVRRIGLGG